MPKLTRHIWPHNNWRWLALTAVVIAADQGAKYVVAETLPLYHSVWLLPFLNLASFHNTGAAFSMFSSAPWLVFVVLAGVVSLCILIWLYRRPHAPALQAAGFCLIMGGAVGNAIDRAARGYVIDYIDFHVGTWHFAAFNIADSAITIGVILLLLDALIEFLRGGVKEPRGR